MRFDRIKHLITPEDLQDKLVLQVGVGSGGAPVTQHLTMNGVRRWSLFDPDEYDEINLVKHPGTRNQVGDLKVKNLRDWIEDRNPSAEVNIYGEDVVSSQMFSETMKDAHLVLCCADKPAVRSYVNSIAVEHRKPCVTANVYRQGFGGEVYAYIPDAFGCFDCMARAADEQGWNIEDTIQPTPEEEQAIYGLNLRDFKASGLSMDIQTIAIIQARTALDILLSGTKRQFTPLPQNWLIFYNRPIPKNELSGFLKLVTLRVKPRIDCVCKTQ